jgi:hypothetical protein
MFSHISVRVIKDSSPLRFRIRQVWKRVNTEMSKVRNTPAYNYDSLHQDGKGKPQQALP